MSDGSSARIFGGSAAGRITVAGGNIDGAVLGNVGGSQNHTLTLAEAPAGQSTLNFSDPDHTHT
jgi:microcystin-dependent protein